MILMWLGPIILMFVGLTIFRKSVSARSGALQVRFITLKPHSSISKMLITTFLAAFGNGSFLQNQYSAVALLNARGSSRRFAILLLCMSAVGAWTTLAGLALAWQISGFYLLSFAGLAYIIWWWSNKGEHSLKGLLGLGLLLVGVEWVLRQQSILLSLLGESEFHFLLADGRFLAQLFWMAIAFAVTILIGFEFWTAFLVMVLLVAGSLSLNGAIGLLTGELLAHTWLLWFRSRRLNPDTRQLVKGYALSSAIGILVGFFIAGLLREVYAWTYSFAASQMVEKSLQLCLLLAVIVIAKSMAAMLWGHFAAQHETDEVQTGSYFSPRWWDRGWITTAVMMFVRRKLTARLQDLEGQAQNFSEAQAKIPPALFKMHEAEMKDLMIWLDESDKGREKF